jgi:hypothetical protein
MKLFTRWVVSAGLVFIAAAANAQVLVPYGIARSPYAAASDIGGPYAAMPRDVPLRRYGPSLLPPEEVYTVVRDSGFSPLGIPQQRGLVYTISVIDRGGDDGRLVIDARTGRIIRVMPAYRMGGNPNADLTVTYGPAAPPPIGVVRGAPRPPGSIPQVASRTVPVPKASPLAARPAPQPTQQSAAMQPKPADALPVPPAAASTIGQVRPAAPTIRPTQEMPEVQGLE